MTAGRPSAVALAVTAGRRLAGFLLMLLLSAAAVFSLELLVPGDPAFTLMATQTSRIPSEAEVAAKRAEIGLDHPFLSRMVHWIGDVAHGDLGRSWATPADVSDLLGPRIGNTLLLGVTALVIAVVLALVLGLAGALRAGRPADHVLRAGVSVFAAVPAFVVGVLVLQFMVTDLGIGRVLADGSVSGALLPASVLGTAMAAAWARPVRAMAVDALSSDAVRVARARGVPPARILRGHVLPAVMLRFLPFIGLGLGALLGATTVVEVVFTWPGMGQYAAQAAMERDLPVLQATVLLSIVAFRVANDLTRAAAWALDPRLRGGPR
ncbi:MAG: ABC transporter permease [Thermoleophilia bacterium]